MEQTNYAIMRNIPVGDWDIPCQVFSPMQDPTRKPEIENDKNV